MRKEHRAFEHCQAYEDTQRTPLSRRKGSIRSYHAGGGSEDSAAQVAYYHDRDGGLRFVFVTAGTVNGTKVEYRVYLAKAGTRLWERRDLKGPGYTFPSQLPDDWLVRDPKQAFHVPSHALRCSKRARSCSARRLARIGASAFPA